MDFIDESGYIADSSDISDGESDVQTESITARAAEILTESLENIEHSEGITFRVGQGSMQDKTTLCFSSVSHSSKNLNDKVIKQHDSHVQVSEPSPNDQPAKISPAKNDSKRHSIRSSSQVSNVTHDSTLMSPRQCPPLQVMDRSGTYEPGRISSSAFTTNSTPREWSMGSNESLFSLHIGHMAMKNGVSETGSQNRQSSFALSDDVISNRASTVARQETTKSTVNTTGGQFRPSTSDKVPHDLIIQRIHDHVDAKARIIPETSWDPRKNVGKVQPMQTSENKKPEKPSSCCKNWRCCLCNCVSLSCCCSASGFCCFRPKCSCGKVPSCNCSLGWCCNWNCCSKKSCCSNGSCFCPKRSCCLSCNQCSKAICCWNWSCWKLLCCWNWSCCSEVSCCKSCSCFSGVSCCKCWSCCSKGACCGSWSCCSCGSCCKSWSCCSKGACCGSWNCCSCGSCCKSWNCCSMESCCKIWNCCPSKSCCKNWNCCLSGSCCKSWSCCPSGLCCKSWSCCKSGSCCPACYNCFKGLCSCNCGSCFKGWNCCSTDMCCCRSFKIKLCCFSSSTKPATRAEPGSPYQNKTKTSGRTGICGWITCSCMQC